MQCALIGKQEEAEQILDREGANANLDYHGITPMWISAYMRKKEVTRTLIKRGAKIDLPAFHDSEILSEVLLAVNKDYCDSLTIYFELLPKIPLDKLEGTTREKAELLKLHLIAFSCYKLKYESKEEVIRIILQKCHFYILTKVILDVVSDHKVLAVYLEWLGSINFDELKGTLKEKEEF